MKEIDIEDCSLSEIYIDGKRIPGYIPMTYTKETIEDSLFSFAEGRGKLPVQDNRLNYDSKED